MSDTMIGETTARLFGDQVDRALLERFERGEWPARLWQQVTDNGLTLALAGEEAGGIGASFADAYPILRGLGYWQVPLPVAETMVAGLLLSAAGLAVPEAPVTLVDETSGIGLGGTDGTVSGTAHRVAWARHCGFALASAGGNLVLIALEGARITPHANAASEPQDSVSFDAAKPLARFANPFPDLAQPLRALGALVKSAAMVGAMEWLLEQSVQYASDRVQFGRPLGKNQAIQQQLALMAGDVASARMAALTACADAPDVARRAVPEAPFSIAVAKVRAGESATRAISIAHQTHGAIGFTMEHQLNHATRRLMAWRESHGADAHWAGELGRAAIAARAAGFWPALTQRRFAGL